MGKVVLFHHVWRETIKLDFNSHILVLSNDEELDIFILAKIYTAYRAFHRQHNQWWTNVHCHCLEDYLL